MRTKILLCSVMLLFAGCSFAPQMKTPDIALPTSVSKKSVNIDTQWWRGFGDQNLNKLIAEALKNNDDLKLAVENVKKARALYGISEAQMYPEIDLGGSATRQSKSLNSYPASYGGTYNNFALSASVAYELDFWGKVRNQEKANFATLLATDALRDALEISLVSDVSSYYFNLVSINEQLRIAKESLKSYEESLHYKEMQLKHGVVDELVVAQARAQVASANTMMQTIQSNRIKVQNALILLLGRNPKEIFENVLMSSKTLPEGINIPSGLSASLLQNRPDIMAAEETLRSKTSLVGVAKAAYFPSISLTGSYGFQSQTLDKLAQSSSLVWGFGPSINVPLFDFGRIRQAVKASKSDQRAAIISYEKAVKIAYKEVFDALETIKISTLKRDATNQEVAAYQNALEIATKKFDHGTATYLDVLDAQKALLNAKLSVADAASGVLIADVTLYKALGGGWSKETKREKFLENKKDDE
ncbi:MAG: efflux transporter outer membrane subunit [Thiovulaceae bacterium]|nr:efflux transporter outer membrane subunit [Sulfurimonadaceae bacterium]